MTANCGARVARTATRIRQIGPVWGTTGFMSLHQQIRAFPAERPFPLGRAWVACGCALGRESGKPGLYPFELDDEAGPTQKGALPLSSGVTGFAQSRTFMKAQRFGYSTPAHTVCHSGQRPQSWRKGFCGKQHHKDSYLSSLGRR